MRFVEAMARRYTAVLMNPPFGEPVPSTKAYLRRRTRGCRPTATCLAAFVGRGLELSSPGVGTCGAITISAAGLFLKTFETWRQSGTACRTLGRALADLGFGVMEQALVEAAAYVAQAAASDQPGIFIRLLKEGDRPTACGACQSTRPERRRATTRACFARAPTTSARYRFPCRLLDDPGHSTTLSRPHPLESTSSG